jgi:periplasmic divalent cation tolerance protein
MVSLLITTVSSAEQATGIAESLVNARLAACVSHAPGLTSTYAWEGKVETASEVLLLIKTQTVLVGAVKTWLAEQHPYEVPEILVFNASDGLETYLSWVKAQTDASGSA